MTRKRKNYYFTQEHEDAIVQYCTTDSQKLKNDLYKEFIGPVFDEMVDKIVYTYKFTTLPNIDALREDCKNWLITILDKYDPNKGSKAFTYFSVVTKKLVYRTSEEDEQTHETRSFAGGFLYR